VELSSLIEKIFSPSGSLITEKKDFLKEYFENPNSYRSRRLLSAITEFPFESRERLFDKDVVKLALEYLRRSEGFPEADCRDELDLMARLANTKNDVWTVALSNVAESQGVVLGEARSEPVRTYQLDYIGTLIAKGRLTTYLDREQGLLKRRAEIFEQIIFNNDGRYDESLNGQMSMLGETLQQISALQRIDEHGWDGNLVLLQGDHYISCKKEDDNTIRINLFKFAPLNGATDKKIPSVFRNAIQSLEDINFKVEHKSKEIEMHMEVKDMTPYHKLIENIRSS